MDFLAPFPLNIGLAVLLVLALYAGYRYFPKRKIFFLFCLVLLGAGIFIAVSHKPAPKPSVSEEQQYVQQQQQHIFINWYTDYKKNIDTINHQWQQYHKIMQAFKNDDISIQTVYTRLKRLQEDAADLRNKLSQLEPPAELDDSNYALTAKIIKKTRDYVDREYEVIVKTKDAADTARLKTNDQPEQVRQLNRVMILHSPVNLSIADEISQIKDNLTLPDDR